MMHWQGGYKYLENHGIVVVMSKQEGFSPPGEAADDIDLVMLMRATAQQDRAAFSRLYRATVRRLYPTALRVTGQAELAEDALSETYIQVWRKAKDYDTGRGSVIGWLSVLCRSRALDILRKRGLVDAGLNEEVVRESSSCCDASSPVDLLQSTESNTALHQALAELGEQQRQLIGLAYFRGYSHSQLAACTGVPLGTVKTQIRRGVDRLKSLMEGISHEQS